MIEGEQESLIRAIDPVTLDAAIVGGMISFIICFSIITVIAQYYPIITTMHLHAIILLLIVGIVAYLSEQRAIRSERK